MTVSGTLARRLGVRWMQIESHGQGDEQRQHIGRHSRPSQQTFNQTDHRQNWAPYCRYCQTEFPSLRDDGFSSRLTQASLSCNCLSCRDNLAYFWLSGGERQDLMGRSEEHTSELQSLMRTSYAVFCLRQNKLTKTKP